MAKNFAEHRQKVIKLAQENMKAAQDRMKKYYDQKRQQVEFKEGDLVLLATRDIPLRHGQQTSREDKSKLIPRYIGPFKISKVVNQNAMKLELPTSMKRLHDVFNVDRLKIYQGNVRQFERRPIPKATPIILDDSGEQLHIIESLLKKRQFNRQTEYLVKWHGLPEHEATWERERDIRKVSHFKRLVQEWRQRSQQDRS
jgi:hypothetical protein